MTLVTVYPDSMSDRGHHLLQALAEPYLYEERKMPEPFLLEGWVTLNGVFQDCRVWVDLFNWKFALEETSEEASVFPRSKSLIARAEQAGQHLLELLVLEGGWPTGLAYYYLHLPGGIEC